MTNFDEVIKRIEKLEYQISILSECIDYERYPVESLILSMNWDDEQLNRAHDIFQKYDTKILQNEKINWNAFEMELCNEFSISYQTVKSIILAFYKNHQWMDVCYRYAMSFEPSTPIEFHQITRNKT